MSDLLHRVFAFQGQSRNDLRRPRGKDNVPCAPPAIARIEVKNSFIAIPRVCARPRPRALCTGPRPCRPRNDPVALRRGRNARVEKPVLAARPPGSNAELRRRDAAQAVRPVAAPQASPSGAVVVSSAGGPRRSASAAFHAAIAPARPRFADKWIGQIQLRGRGNPARQEQTKPRPPLSPRCSSRCRLLGRNLSAEPGADDGEHAAAGGGLMHLVRLCRSRRARGSQERCVLPRSTPCAPRRTGATGWAHRASRRDSCFQCSSSSATTCGRRSAVTTRCRRRTRPTSSG